MNGHENLSTESIIKPRSDVTWADRLYLVALGAYGTLMANWFIEILRLTSPSTNYTVMEVALWMPAVLVVLAFFREGWDGKIVGAVFALPLVALSLVLALVEGVTGMTSFEPIDSIPLAHSRITVYRTNGGATTAYGIVLRQEKVLVRGLMLVKRIRVVYPASEAKVSVTGENTVRLVVASYGTDETLTVRRWVYF
jgi:hypothetical protein